MNLNIRKKFAEYYLYFMMYSILGWIYEVFLEVVVYRWGFSNRGVLFGPYCIIYGTGALILIFCLSGLQKKRIYLGKVLITPVLVFIGIVVITTVLELIASYIMEFTQGEWLWDYTPVFFQFRGADRPESEHPLRNRRHGLPISASALIQETDRQNVRQSALHCQPDLTDPVYR